MRGDRFRQGGEATCNESLLVEQPMSGSIQQFLIQNKEVLDSVWEEYQKKSWHERTRTSRSMKDRERFFEQIDILEMFEAFGVDVNQLDITQDEHGFFIIGDTEHEVLRDLPNGYGVHGGTARAQLEKLLGVGGLHKKRDIDIVRFSKEEPSDAKDLTVAEEFMPDDVAHGHGVEVIESISEFFESRDFTINQLVVMNNGTLIAHESCVKDTLRGILRITEGEKKFYGSEIPGPKLFSKMVRLWVRGIEHYGPEKILVGVDEWFESDIYLPPFYIALQVDKAYEENTTLGRKTLEAFMRFLPPEVSTIEGALLYLQSEMRDFVFRYAPVSDEKSAQEERCFEKYEDSYRELVQLPKQRGHARSRGNK